MIFRETDLDGVVVVELDLSVDERGSFARTFDVDEWRNRGLCPDVSQCSVSRNADRGTLRGMHYQAEPYGEHKLVRCSRGAIFDVALDLRPESETFCSWVGVELSEGSDTMLHIPAGCAHGFVTLAAGTEVLYQISTPYMPSHARGVRWDDPGFDIRWPVTPTTMSERDRSYPDFVR
jgi:dTDP-4-dehydrorhamnose 3,5-epimerase